MKRTATLICGALVSALPLAATALDPSLPSGARALSERVNPLANYVLPVGPYFNGVVPGQTFSGVVSRKSWRITGATATSLQLLLPLRAELIEAGFTVLFECDSPTCGGFDFRFGIDVVAAPDMYVDIRDYQFLSAVRGADEAVSLLVSRSRSAAHVQMITVGPTGESPPITLAPKVDAIEAKPVDQPGSAQVLATRLLNDGHAALTDLEFPVGAEGLANGPYASLADLSEFLQENPQLRIVVVGHTDSVGSLEANIELSRQRAQAVVDRLIADYAVDPKQAEAAGMGYLAPVASNLEKAGREANRRVEVVVLPAN